MFSWVKVHIGIHDNELADIVDEEAAQNTAKHYNYTKLSKFTFAT